MKKLFFNIVIFLLFNSAFSQTPVTFTFMGKDANNQNLIPLDSVYVLNVTEDCDTIVYGPDPVLSLMATLPVGIHENKINTSEDFILKQNYPNPFRGNTLVSIYREYSGPLNFILFDGIGTKLAEYQNEFEKGFHSFTVSSSGNKVLILTVFDSKNCRSIKIISAEQGINHYAIQYLGSTPDIEKGGLKSGDRSGFIFYLGNQIMYTAYATRYYEQIITDYPVADSTYTFNMSMILNFPAVTTAPVTDITPTTATSGGNVSSDGGAPVTARGVCWSIIPGPTTVSDHTSNGSGTGSFVSNLTWLNPNTPYYIRAYATNSVGTAYGEELTFTTLAAELPTVTTTPASYITQSTATSGGNVTSDGGDFVTARGVCWSISPNPTTADSHTSDGGGNGSFESYLSGLTPNTPYYIRAYATNSAGTAYGEELTFTTLFAELPTVTTTPVTDITNITATSGGNVISDGGGAVTERGVCWSNLPDPTTSDSHTTDGSGTGTFISYLTGLAADTLYYVRAYATNSVGTAYGSQVSFTTDASSCPSTVTDIEGNVYNTVLISDQCWMAENLKTTTYNNNTPIPNVTNAGSWGNQTTGAYVWFNNDISWKDLYGALYNWYTTVDANGLCPTGWHVPTNGEWTQLTDFIGGIGSPHGSELKSCRQVNSPLGGECQTSDHPRWDASGQSHGTDDYGFSGFPGGFRNDYGEFWSLGGSGVWWSSTAFSSGFSWHRELTYASGEVWVSHYLKVHGHSVRCLKD